MKPPAIFALLVRAVGLYLLYQSIHTLSNVMALTASAQNNQLYRNTFGASWLTVIILAGASVWFLFGAPPIQDWAYPEAKDSPEKPSASPESKLADAGSFHCVSCDVTMPAGTRQCPHCGWTQP